MLSKYCCLVVDEAHERTISIDVILGRIKHIINHRKNFKVIVTSASLDAEKLSQYFSVQIVKIPGRKFPVNEIYRPMNNVISVKEKIEHILKDEIFRGNYSRIQEEYYGHILVFCTGIGELE